MFRVNRVSASELSLPRQCSLGLALLLLIWQPQNGNLAIDWATASLVSMLFKIVRKGFSRLCEKLEKKICRIGSP